MHAVLGFVEDDAVLAFKDIFRHFDAVETEFRIHVLLKFAETVLLDRFSSAFRKLDQEADALTW